MRSRMPCKPNPPPVSFVPARPLARPVAPVPSGQGPLVTTSTVACAVEVEMDRDRRARRVLAGIGHRLLGGAVERQTGIGVERAGHAGHGELGTVVLGQGLELLGQRDRFVAQRVHRLARLLQPLHGEPPCLLDQLTTLARVVAALQQGVGGVELDRQGTERVSQHVVDLSSHPVALGQGCGTVAFGVGPDPLGQQLFGLQCPILVVAASGAGMRPMAMEAAASAIDDRRAADRRHGHHQRAEPDRPDRPAPAGPRRRSPPRAPATAMEGDGHRGERGEGATRGGEKGEEAPRASAGAPEPAAGHPTDPADAGARP